MRLAIDPMGDVEDLLLHVADAGVDRRRSSFVSYFVHFDERSRWERAALAAARHGWDTAAYSNGDHHVVRLSHNGRVTAQRLREQRSQLRRFARNFDGQWEALAIEQLGAPTYWDEIADGLLPRRTPEENVPVVRPISAQLDAGVRRVRRAS